MGTPPPNARAAAPFFGRTHANRPPAGDERITRSAAKVNAVRTVLKRDFDDIRIDDRDGNVRDAHICNRKIEPVRPIERMRLPDQEVICVSMRVLKRKPLTHRFGWFRQSRGAGRQQHRRPRPSHRTTTRGAWCLRSCLAPNDFSFGGFAPLSACRVTGARVWSASAP